MAYTRITDLVTSTEGSAFITVNGKNRYFFEPSKIDASIEFKVVAKRLLGHRMTQHKVVGAEGKGSLTIYNVSGDTLQIFMEYKKSGIYLPITIQTTNEDPQSTIGRQTVVMRNCVLAKIPVASLDDSSEDLSTVDTDFTFDDVDNLEQFQIPENFR